MSRPEPYTLDILRLAAAIPDIGLLPDAPAARRRSPTCGAVMAVSVTLDEAGRVAALGQDVSACAYGQAAAALMARGARGRTLAEAREALAGIDEWLVGGPVPDWPGLVALSPAQARPGRHGAVRLPWQALVAAMEAAQ